MSTGPSPSDFGADDGSDAGKPVAPAPDPNSEPGSMPAFDLAEFAEAVQHHRPWRLIHLMYLVAAAAVVAWFFKTVFLAFWFGVLGGFGLLVGTFVFAMGWGSFLARRRAARQDALLSVLAIAAERGMPMAPAIWAFGEQFHGLARARLTNLAARLNQGGALPVALEDCRAVSSDAVLLARIGQECGTLPQAIKLAARTRSSQLPIWTTIAARLSYVLGLLLAMQVICFFVFYFILPKMEAIFKDFSIPLPPVTIRTVEASHFVVKYFGLVFWLPPLELGLLFLLPWSFRGWGNSSVPLFDRLLARRHTALVLRALSLAVEGRKPLAQGLSILAHHYPTKWVRRRLAATCIEIATGADWVDALWRNRVIRGPDAEVLLSAALVGNLSWALEELAVTIERRLATRAQAVVELLFPLTVIALGCVVFILAVAYFAPLVELITMLAR